MTRVFSFVRCMSILVMILVASSEIAVAKPSRRLTTRNRISRQPCLTDAEVSAALEQISFGQTYEEQSRAVARLRAGAGRSTICRKQVIDAFLKAMDKPNLDVTIGRPSFFLWHYGSGLLGNLKAVEALDFLIAHLDLNDGTEFPLNHHPAIGSVVNMGEIALPKLSQALRENPDRFIRRCVAFCIALIGGTEARKALRQAVNSESDHCVTVFIKASLDAFNNRTFTNHITSENRTKWYSTFLCNGE